MSANTQKVIRLVPPDGGWGWMVVFGAALSNIFNMSMISLFSLLYGDALEEMGYKTQGAAFVLGTCLFVSNFAGLLAGALVKLTSPRCVALIGACFCSTGIFLSGLSTNIWHLTIAYGVLLGLGLNFISNATFVSINSYFKLKKNRAVGLAYVGTCMGQIFVPQVVRFLLDTYGFRGACFLLSSFSFHGVAGSLLLQPVERHMKKVAVELPVDAPQNVIQDEKKDTVFRKLKQTSNGVYDKNKQLTEFYTPRHSFKLQELKVRQENNTYVNHELKNNSEITSPAANATVNPIAEKKASLAKKFYNLLGISLLTDIRFNNTIVGTALTTTSVTNFGLVFPFFLQEVALMDKQQTAYCMSATSAADMMARLIIPTFQDKYKIKARWIVIISCICLIINRQILAYQTGMELLLFMSVLCGFSRSMTIVCKNIAISENCTLDQVPAAVGLGMFTTGLITPPLGYFLGWVRDYTGSYIHCITAQNALLIVVLATWIPDMLYLHVKERKQQKKDPETKP